MHRLIAAGTASVALAALVCSGSAQSYSSAAVSCGQTVTASVTLAGDLVGCPSTGLVIGADGITVDLGGHTISGTNAPKSEGITNDGHAGVKILNGSVTNFRLYGVAIRHAGGAVVSKLAVRRIGAGTKQGEHSAGILLDHSPGSTIADSVVSNQVRAYRADGVDVLSSGRTRIERNQLDDNAWNGLTLIQSPKSRIVGNHLDGNKRNGMEANVASDSLVVYTNQAADNRKSGMVVGALRHADVLGNTLTGNGRDGLLLFDLGGSMIRGNRATGNRDGMELYGGRTGSRHNQLAVNKAAYNAHTGIWVHGDSPKSSANSNVLSGNVASHNGPGGGILIQGSARGNSLLGNTANSNRGRGVTAVTGTIDGGANHARGNKRSPQCVGVKCR